MTNAIGIGYHQSSGNGQCVKDGALTKRMGPGMAVRGGIASALMAKRGITGARNCLEGAAGMYQVYHGRSYSREKLVDELGTRFEGVNVSIKPYPCCRGVHPFIDAGSGARGASTTSSPTTWRASSSTAEKAPTGCSGSPLEVKARPRNFVDSQFSIVWGVATAIARRRATLDDFTPEAIKSPDILGVIGQDRRADRPRTSTAATRASSRRGWTITMNDGGGLHRAGGPPHRHAVAAAVVRGHRAQVRRLPGARRAADPGRERAERWWRPSPGSRSWKTFET